MSEENTITIESTGFDAVNKAPAFQFYPQDFLMGTIEMSAEQVGGYIRLLCHQWDKGFVPDNDKKLLNLSGVRKSALEGIKEKFVKNAEGNLINVRLESVRARQRDFKEKRAAAGQLGGKVRLQRLEEAKKRGDHKEPEWMEMYLFFNECVKCGDIDKLTKDHIIPLYQGGDNAITNIQPLCLKCNMKKGPDNTDYRIKWCQANAKQMPSKWLANLNQNSSSLSSSLSSTSSSEEKESRGDKSPSQPSLKFPEKKKVLKKPEFIPPTEKEVADYFTELQENIWDSALIELQARKFYNHYNGIGWVKNKVKIKDWRSVVQTWIMNHKEFTNDRNSNKTGKEKPISGRLTATAAQSFIADTSGFKQPG